MFESGDFKLRQKRGLTLWRERQKPEENVVPGEGQAPFLTEPNRTPLTAFERYLLRSEDVGGRMTFTVEIDCAGVFDADILGQAIEATAAVHPLLRSRVKAPEPSAQWHPGEPAALRVSSCPELPPSFAAPLRHIDLSREPGFQSDLLRCDDGTSRLILSFHHACTDGQGSAAFLRDLSRSYAAISAGERIRLRSDLQPLDRRGERPQDQHEGKIGGWDALRNLWVTVRGRTLRLPATSASAVADNDEASDRAVELTLADDQAATVRQRAAEASIPLNDFALAAAFLMFADVFGSEERGRYVTLLNPVDMRSWADRRMPAANRVGFAYVRRRGSELTNPAEVLESVNEQMTYVRGRGVAAELSKGIELAEKIPPLLRLIELSGRFTPTATVTCLSNLTLGKRFGMQKAKQGWSTGGVVVRRISATAPRPAGVPAALAVIQSGGTIILTMRADPHYLTSESMVRMCTMWRDAWIRICEN